MSFVSVDEYHVGIICALDSELTAVEAMFDEEFEEPSEKNASDDNTYCFGRIHKHNVVVACLPAGVDGLAAAAIVAKDMSRTFGQIRFGLMVGIGGGIPNLADGNDIRLGDIVVSHPTGTTGGIVQYDKGKIEAGNQLRPKGMLNSPPKVLLTALQKIRAKHRRADGQVPEYLSQMFDKYPKMRKTGYTYPGQDRDILFGAEYDCVSGHNQCKNCDPKLAIARPLRDTHHPEVHYGTIASGNLVIKNALMRDLLYQSCGALCVEMEAAGLMNDFPCLVIRGICDYADSHKNDQWHGYAAAAAAAYAKELLLYISPQVAKQTTPVKDVLSSLQQHLDETRIHHEKVQEHHALQANFNQYQEIRYKNEEHRECHLAFKTINYEEEKDRNRIREPGTCEWVRQHPRYKSWLANDNDDLLWISADPGCGKSVLSRSLIDQDLQADSTALGNHSRLTVLYYFFKDTEGQGTLSFALCSLIHQLFVKQRHLIQYALDVWKDNGNRIQKEIAKLWSILQDAAANSQSEPVICVLDALDECRETDRGTLMNELKFFYTRSRDLSSKSYSLKFLITSRPYNNIEQAFQRIVSSLPSIHIRGENENDQIRKEIDIVTRSRVDLISRELGLSKVLRDRIENRLLEMQNRTYLWLHLAIDSIPGLLEASLRPSQETFESIPTTVDEAYEHILSRVADNLKDRVQKILLIIIGASRPLAVGEMSLALGVACAPKTATALNSLDIEPDHLRTNIREWCRLFIYLNHDRLFLIHQTAKEFLLRATANDISTIGNAWKHCLSPLDIELTMARMYMQYLCIDHFATTTVERWQTTQEPDSLKDGDSPLPKRHKHLYSFFQLAAENWSRHWQCVESEQLKEAMKREIRLLTNQESRIYRNWRSIMFYPTGNRRRTVVIIREPNQTQVIQERRDRFSDGRKWR